jgi:hypothetical protein
MLFKEIIAVRIRDLYKTDKYRMQNYWLVKQVLHVVSTRL